MDRRRQGQLAAMELEKLALYRLDGPIGPDDVRALVAEAVPASTWAFLDAIAWRRIGDAADLLERVLDVTPEPVILAVLHRRLRELIAVADLWPPGRLRELPRLMGSISSVPRRWPSRRPAGRWPSSEPPSTACSSSMRSSRVPAGRGR